MLHVNVSVYQVYTMKYLLESQYDDILARLLDSVLWQPPLVSQCIIDEDRLAHVKKTVYTFISHAANSSMQHFQ